VTEDLVPAAGPEVANLTEELAARTLAQDVPNDLRLPLLKQICKQRGGRRVVS